ncbi:hypothetical protein ACFSQQ_03080 [Mesorhizobium kowhaii]|uniref:hypothetical protein n=1 Tax=Mesorhizobium kowhaii TaxID=1300272 RepID=UPI0035E74404
MKQRKHPEQHRDDDDSAADAQHAGQHTGRHAGDGQTGDQHCNRQPVEYRRVESEVHHDFPLNGRPRHSLADTFGRARPLLRPDARRPSVQWFWDATGYFFVLTQFPRESAMRFSRENRFTLFLELL